jgi:hypothetical protein
MNPEQRGAQGEQLVSDGLAKLPSTYQRIANLVVPVNRWSTQTTQIDHVISCPFGIFVVETKRFQGTVSGEEHDLLWFQNLGGRRFAFRNPLNQNRHHVSVLAHHLKLPSSVFRPVMAFVGLTRLVSPHLPVNVLSTIAPGVPGLRRYIDQFTQTVLSPQELFTATAKLIDIKNNGLTVEDHLRSIRNCDLGRRLDEAMRLRRKTHSGNL